MEITQEQIEQLKEVGNEKTKELLNEWFGIKIEPHVWYYWEGHLANYILAYSNVEKNEVYGFVYGKWFENSYFEPKSYFRLATKKEVEPLLIAEAKKRGYKNGNYECLSYMGTDNVADENDYDCDYDCNELWQGTNTIYKKGKWAEIIQTMTIEEAEKS